MFKQSSPLLGRHFNHWARGFHHGKCRHHQRRTRARRCGKQSTGAHGNRFLFYLGMTTPEKMNLSAQKLLDKSQEIYENRIEIDNFAREHVRPEWHEQERDPYSPTPLAIRRFMWEAKQRRKFHDKRYMWVEEMLDEEIEDKHSATFRAWPEEPRAQETVHPESYTNPTIEDLMRPRTDAETEAWCQPADTYYSKKPPQQANFA